ncbi:MAG: hypothetical protein J0I07_26100 [Myxococcales bacterium]|nr:hypothetical protein [Myxococcales bacterium]
MVQKGEAQLGRALELAGRVRRRIEDLPGLHVLRDELLGVEASHDHDPLHVLIDVERLGISGYRAADWLRDNCGIDMGISDSRRIEATMSLSDDETTTDRLLEALKALIAAAPSIPSPSRVELPTSSDLELETVLLPRDAFFGPAEVIPTEEADGRIAAEQVTPYPPGIPVILPGERINRNVIEYLRTGVEAGMVLPDPADPSMQTIRVVQQ